MKPLKNSIPIAVIFIKNSFCKTKKGSYICNRNQKMIVSYWRNGRVVDCGSLENC